MDILDETEFSIRALSRGQALRGGLKVGHLRLVVALDETRQISAAAQVMNISQPAASRMIAEMEGILGATLCTRLPRGIELTSYGAALARRARTILLEMGQIDREFADLKSGRGGSVSLGAVTAPAIELAVPAIRRMRATHPRVEINLQVESSNALARELIASRLDFVIARIPDELDPRLFDSRVIGIEKAALIVRRGHPLLDGRTVAIEKLYDYDWVLQPSGSLLRRTVEALFLSRDLPLPERVLNTTSVLMTLVMVVQSDAVAVVSVEVARFVCGEAGLAGAVDVLPVDFDVVIQPYSLIQIKNRSLSPTAQALKTFILNEVQ